MVQAAVYLKDLVPFWNCVAPGARSKPKSYPIDSSLDVYECISLFYIGLINYCFIS